MQFMSNQKECCDGFLCTLHISSISREVINSMAADGPAPCVPTLHWRHNERDGVSNHQPHDCLLNCLFRRRSKKTSKLRVTGLCAGNSLVAGEFPAQKDSNTENVSIWWRHHACHRQQLHWLCAINGSLPSMKKYFNKQPTSMLRNESH